jgi:hypothetical protein
MSNRLPTQPNLSPTLVFNPRLSPVTYTFANDDGTSTEYVLYGLEATTLPYYLAHKIANKLADQIYFERGRKNNYEMDKAEILKEILV